MFNNIPYNKNIISYHGPVNIDLISFMAKYIRDMIEANQVIVNRMHKVLVELTQNVSYYSAQVRNCSGNPNLQKGVGWFSIDEEEEAFVISTGNLIKKEHAPVLEKNCKEINRLDEQELRQLKRKTRSQSNIRDIGAHIGLIHTGLISGNPLQVEFNVIDEDHSFFKISVEINK